MAFESFVERVRECVCVFIKETEVQCIFICTIDLFLPPLPRLLSVESLPFSSGGNGEPRDLRSACRRCKRRRSRTLAAYTCTHGKKEKKKKLINLFQRTF